MNRSPILAPTIRSVAAVFALVLPMFVPAAASAKAAEADPKLVKRGAYLVEFGGCHDCHTPKKMGGNGMPEPIPALALSGHPADMQLPPAPKLPSGPWIAATTGSMTAWSGPWGVSYAANLTPDPETGLGKWTEQNFIEAMRTGRHMGRGRPILPPMPWDDVKKLTDSDLKAMFAYLRSLPAIKNRVPDPTPPEVPPAPAPGPSASGK